jgi:hypothetical protein
VRCVERVTKVWDEAELERRATVAAPMPSTTQGAHAVLLEPGLIESLTGEGSGLLVTFVAKGDHMLGYVLREAQSSGSQVLDGPSGVFVVRGQR